MTRAPPAQERLGVLLVMKRVRARPGAHQHWSAWGCCLDVRVGVRGCYTGRNPGSTSTGAPGRAAYVRVGVRGLGRACWLNVSPRRSTVRMRSVLRATAQKPSGHCSDAKPLAWSSASYDTGASM